MGNVLLTFLISLLTLLGSIIIYSNSEGSLSGSAKVAIGFLLIIAFSFFCWFIYWAIRLAIQHEKK